MKFKHLPAFILNLPYTFVGIITALVLFPKKVTFNKENSALVFYVKGEYVFFTYMKGWRGMALGNVVIPNPREFPNDLEHELIHLEQYRRYPLIMFWMNLLELLRKGYKNNRFEIEAYARSNSLYVSGTSSTHDNSKV
ncbi:MAG: hypothetical protein JWN90_309 [Parcubacteria group bacterium]|nr:hypothetical protein [Parcubacteria group bacterium]